MNGISSASTNNAGFIELTDYITLSGTADWQVSNDSSAVVNVKDLHPELFFKYAKSKFRPLERRRLDNRIKKVEKAFDAAVENGQDALAMKFLNSIGKELKESVIYAKGIRYYVEKSDLHKYKHKIRGGHISDTKFSEYTRLIPQDVLKKKKKVEDVFDDFVIYHYWNEAAGDVSKMSEDEKAKMKDPVLFGLVKETKRLYFVADWIDEYCDLTFEEMADVLGKDEEEITLTREPETL